MCSTTACCSGVSAASTVRTRPWVNRNRPTPVSTSSPADSAWLAAGRHPAVGRSSSRATTVSSNSSASSDAARRSRWAGGSSLRTRAMTISARLPAACPVPAASRRASSRRNSGLPLLACAARRTSSRSSSRPDRGPQQVGDGGLVEPTQDAASTSAPLSRSGPTCSHPTPASPVRRVAQQTTPAASRVAQQQPQRQQRRLVGPLDVVDDEQAAPVRHHHVAQRAEQREPVLGLVGPDLRHSWRHTQNGGAPSSAPCAHRTRVDGGVGQRPHQARLADARFALDDDEPRGSERAGIGHVPQPRELVVAAEQPARHRPSLSAVRPGLPPA